jgi:glucosamine--fructose-6-phosphate aminotransferase (isomerizing)
LTRIALDIAEQPAILERVTEANAEALGHARGLIAAAHAVRFVAIGSSRHCAGFGAAAVEHLAGASASLVAGPGWDVPLPPIAPDDVVVAVSQSGATPAVLDAVRQVALQGTPVIAVTNEAGTDLAGLATVNLVCDAGAERVVAATKSVTATLLLLRALAAPIAPACLAALGDAARAVIDGDVSDSVDPSGGPPAWVVANGVAAEWVADEIALKFGELAGHPVPAETVIEFLHGPAAAHGPVLAFVDATDPNVTTLTARDDVTLITSPITGDPWLDAVVAVIAGQRVAVAWAAALGVDPDASKGLVKVTRTL